jgi:preprotein translocase subunit SecG
MLTFFRVLLIVVEVIVSVLLVAVILVQKSKGQGLGLGFGGGMSEQMLGGQAGNVLTKITVILAATFFVVTMALGFLYTDRDTARSIMQNYEVVPVAQPATAPLQSQPGAGFTGGDAAPFSLDAAPAALDAAGEVGPVEAAPEAGPATPAMPPVTIAVPEADMDAPADVPADDATEAERAPAN